MHGALLAEGQTLIRNAIWLKSIIHNTISDLQISRGSFPLNVDFGIHLTLNYSTICFEYDRGCD